MVLIISSKAQSVRSNEPYFPALVVEKIPHYDVMCQPFILQSCSLTHQVLQFFAADTNLAVPLACGHTVSLYVCPGNNSNCNALTHGDMVSLDEGRFPALELNNRRLSVKNSFCRKNGVYTRSVIHSDIFSFLK